MNMEIPISFWEAIGTAITLTAIGFFLWNMSRIYKNVIQSHRKQGHQTSIEYKDCNITPDKMELHKHY